MTTPHPNRRILVIDDNRAIHRDFQKIFAPNVNDAFLQADEAVLFGETSDLSSRRQFEIDSAFQGQEGLAMVEKATAEGRPYAMAFVDVRMPPGWDGVETISRIWKVCPDLQIVICTAYSDYSWDDMKTKLGDSDQLVILKKPFDSIEVLQLTGALVEKWRLLQQSRQHLVELEATVSLRTAELQNKTVLLEALVDSSLDGILVVDEKRDQLVKNQQFARLFKIPAHLTEQKSDERQLEFVVDSIKDPKQFRERVEYLYNHPDETGRDEIELKDGSVLDRFSAPVRSPDSTHHGRIWMFRDITALKRAHEVLTEQLALRERLAKIAASAPGIIYTFRLRPDGSTCIPYASPTMEEFYGVRPEALVDDATPVFELIHLDDQALMQDSIAESARTLLPWRTEFRVRHPRKGLFWVEGQSTPEPQADGSILWHGFMSDVTGRKRTEEALRASEEKYRDLFERSRDAIVTMDPATGRFASGNPAALKMFGAKSQEELLSCGPAELSPARQPDGTSSAGKARELVETVLREGSHTFEWTHRRINGEEFSADVLLARMEQGGKPVILATVRDISERRRTEETLRLQTSALKATVTGIAITDRTGHILWVNPAFSRLTGYSAEEVLGKKTSILKSGKHDASFYKYMWNTILSGYVWQGELVNRRKDGSLYHEEMTVTPVLDEHGDIKNFVAVKQDISERKRAEESLRESEGKFRQLADNISDVFWITSPDFKTIHYISSGYEQIWGRSSESLYANPHQWVESVLPEERDRVFGIFSGLIGDIPEVSVEYRIARPDGTIRWVHDRGFQVRDADGKLVRLTGIACDITDRKQTEQSQQMMELQLRQAQKMEAIGQLAAGIAHEINTPTQYVGDNTRFLKDAFTDLKAVLQSHAEILAAARQNALTPEILARAEATLASSDLEYLSEQIPAAITETLEGVERVAKIVRAMKEFSHPGGKEKAPANLNKAIESTVTVARNEWKYVADLTLELQKDLPLVPCFLGEFNQVMLNLIVNASHAINDVVKTKPGSKGTITIKTRRDGDDVEIRVSDTGTGIAESHRAHIFEPFFTTKDVGKGTGQGLSVIYNSIVKKHSGTVDFETEVGKGTTFILRLPLILKSNAVELPILKHAAAMEASVS